MGFQKGVISLNPLRDVPLLLQVLHSQFITHDQLFEFMQRAFYRDHAGTVQLAPFVDS